MRTLYCFAFLHSLLSSDVIGSPIYPRSALNPAGLAPRDDCNPTTTPTSTLPTAVFTVDASIFDSGATESPVPVSTVCVDFISSKGSVTPSAWFCTSQGASSQPTGTPLPRNNPPFANSTGGLSSQPPPFPSSMAPVSPRAPFVIVPGRGPGVDFPSPTVNGAAFSTSQSESSTTPVRACGSKTSTYSSSETSFSSVAIPQTVHLPKGAPKFSTPTGMEPSSLMDSNTNPTATVESFRSTESLNPLTTPTIEPNTSSQQISQPPSFTTPALAFSPDPQPSSGTMAHSTQPLATPSATPGSFSPDSPAGIDIDPFE